jgi:hypothetical protein
MKKEEDVCQMRTRTHALMPLPVPVSHRSVSNVKIQDNMFIFIKNIVQILYMYTHGWYGYL